MTDDLLADGTLQVTTVDYERLEADLPRVRTSYAAAQPFPHVVLDDVLLPEVFDRAAEEFPGLRDERWNGYLHVNETKYSNTDPETWGTTLTSVAREFCSPRFVRYLTTP